MNENFLSEYNKFMNKENINDILRDIMDLYRKIKDLEDEPIQEQISEKVANETIEDLKESVNTARDFDDPYFPRP